MSGDEDVDRLIRDARPVVPAGFAGAVAQKVAVAAAAQARGRRRRWRRIAGSVSIVAVAAALLLALWPSGGEPVTKSAGSVWIVDGQTLSHGATTALLLGAADVTADGNDLILQRGKLRLSGPAAVVTPRARVVSIGDAALVDVDVVNPNPEPQEKAMTTVKLGVLATVAAGSVLTVTVIRGTADVRPAPPDKPVTLAAGDTLTLPTPPPLVAGGERTSSSSPAGSPGAIVRMAPGGETEAVECPPAAETEGCPGCAEAPEDCGGCEGCPGCGAGGGCAGHAVAVDDVTPEPVAIDIEGAPALGKADARVVIVEFGDFQCQFCEQAMSIIHELADLYPNDVRVVFKNFPMPGHKDARLAAEAALAAGEQGKFWEMYDLLYANREALDFGSLLSYAQQLGLDSRRFDIALRRHTHAAQIDRDIADATAAGIKGIPTFFINGRVVVGVRPLDVLKGIVDEELARAQ